MTDEHTTDEPTTDEPTTGRWAADLLARIDAADDLHVSPLRDDGATYGTPTWIWCVVVDGELYVRPYNGPRSRWYAAATARPDGRIRAAGQSFDVTFEPAPAELVSRIDEAYRAKYSTSPYLPPMVADQARRTGVRIRPRGTATAARIGDTHTTH